MRRNPPGDGIRLRKPKLHGLLSPRLQRVSAALRSGGPILQLYSRMHCQSLLDERLEPYTLDLLMGQRTVSTSWTTVIGHTRRSQVHLTLTFSSSDSMNSSPARKHSNLGSFDCSATLDMRLPHIFPTVAAGDTKASAARTKRNRVAET